MLLANRYALAAAQAGQPLEPVVRRGIAGLAQRRARAVALRDAVRDGWDADAVAQALLTLREPTLW